MVACVRRCLVASYLWCCGMVAATTSFDGNCLVQLRAQTAINSAAAVPTAEAVAAAAAAAEARSGVSNPTVLFSIQTGPNQKLMQRLQACLSTWAADLQPKELQIVGRAPRASSGEADLASWDEAGRCGDNHDAGVCKDAVALVAGFKSGADWVMLVGDDNYVLPSNIRSALEHFNASDPMILGIPGCGNCTAGGLCGGGGQVFSHAALKLMLSVGKETFLQQSAIEAVPAGMYGDVAHCRVAAHYNIPVHLLTGLHPWDVQGPELEAALHSQDPLPLTFHYLNPEHMHSLHRMVRGLSLLETMAGKQEAHDSLVPAYLRRMEQYVQEENLLRFRLMAAEAVEAMPY